MSNYHYYESNSTSHGAAYAPLAATTTYDCNNQCSCRFDDGRSTRDMMDYNFFVLGKPMELSPYQAYVNPRGAPLFQAPPPYPSLRK